VNPLDIYQAALDRVSNAVLLGDFDTYADQIDLPYLIHTETARHLVTTREDLRPTFLALHEALMAERVTHYERVAREADYVHRDRIEGWHHAHLISNGERVNYPHVSRHAIVRRGDRWLFSEAHYPVRADSWPVTKDTLLEQFGIKKGLVE
jgi:hypothetical protein